MAIVDVEGRHPAEFVMLEGSMAYNREAVTIAQSGKLEPGSVVGKITASGNYALSPDAETEGVEGAEVAVGILIYGVDATDGDVEGLIFTRPGAIANHHRLVYDASVDDAEKIGAKVDQLEEVGVVVR